VEAEKLKTQIDNQKSQKVAERHKFVLGVTSLAKKSAQPSACLGFCVNLRKQYMTYTIGIICRKGT
jgi:hypothetical protein